MLLSQEIETFIGTRRNNLLRREYNQPQLSGGELVPYRKDCRGGG